MAASISSRSKFLVTLALNKQLKDNMQKAKVQKRKQNVTAICHEQQDPDYSPENESHSSLDTSFLAEDSSAYHQNTKVPRLDSHITAESTEVDVEIKTNNQSNYDLVKEIVADIINLSLDCVDKKINKSFTKKGNPRKRQSFDRTASERKKIKKTTESSQHKVNGTCNSNTCLRKCSKFIDEIRQEDINKQYWTLGKEEKRLFVNGCAKKMSKGRCTTVVGNNSRRQNTYKYFLKDSEGMDVNVCKVFFLLTLGYNKNDRILKNIRATSKTTITPLAGKRGHRPAINKIDKDPIINHIKTFQPNISHYRREHAPKRLYLPSDINITMMYLDFKSKNPNFTGSYELYRKEVSAMNISFAQLGCEECFPCTALKLHKTEENHEDPIDYTNCDVCSNYLNHKAKYIAARKEYEKDATKIESESELTVSVDLEKVIMLPRAEMFKEVIFVPRITVFNESFVPTGKGKQLKPLAVLWHEGIAKRNKEDIISAYYAFFLKNRDKENITIWMDNCSAQNKNWALISFFVYIVRCKEIALKTLRIKYFEPGHSFMSADHFHHQVELAMKKHKTIWDFDDFVSCVSSANGGKTDVIKMNLTTFFDWNDFSSKFKLKKEKFYFKNLTVAVFIRNENSFQYKTSFDEGEEFKTLNFLNNKVVKNGIPMANARQKNHGVDLTRRNNLVSTLGRIIPKTRLKFWQELDVYNTDGPPNDDYDESE